MKVTLHFYFISLIFLKEKENGVIVHLGPVYCPWATMNTAIRIMACVLALVLLFSTAFVGIFKRRKMITSLVL